MKRHDHRVVRYLEAVAKLCLEVAAEPRLLPLFVAIIALVPATIAQLKRDSERLAA
jgi:hypothetical protein